MPSTPDARMIEAAVKCDTVPTPEPATRMAPGRACIYARNAARLVQPSRRARSALTTQSTALSVICVRARRSCIGSNGIDCMAGVASRVAAPTMPSTEPSAGPLATASAPTMPPPPARFSTMTVWPSTGPSRSARMRPRLSTAPPGGKGTMMRNGRRPESCASAGRGNAASARAWRRMSMGMGGGPPAPIVRDKCRPGKRHCKGAPVPASRHPV